MGEFQRSPSKVWWSGGEELVNRSNWRANSASPGSQDSGFSDTETSPHDQGAKNIPEELLKKDSIKKTNLTSNIVEKSTPHKDLMSPKNGYCLQATPVRKIEHQQSKSEPPGRFTKNRNNYARVSRNLFRSIQMEASSADANQYAGNDSISSEVTSDESISWLSSDSELPECIKTLPLASSPTASYPPNLSAPAILQEEDEVEDNDEAVTSFNQSTDSDSELDGLFQPPKHTSTPKMPGEKDTEVNMLRRVHARNLLEKYKNERVPPTTVESVEEGTALKKWMDDMRRMYEPECMITLQTKSIAGDLADRVSQIASNLTYPLRQLIHYNGLVEKEFDSLKNQKKHQRPLAQSLVGIVLDYFLKFPTKCKLLELTDDLRTASAEAIPKITAQMHVDWNSFFKQKLNSELAKILESLQAPRNELDVRANLTALTSITLRNEDLIELFVNAQAVDIIVILLEKCDGSSVRGLCLRALSTLCVSAGAIRDFESAGGVQILGEIICDETRPEPERTEGIALLAQITAPWIEDNHTVRGLNAQTKKLIKYLTKYLKSTKCCQSILLAAAALASLTAMDVKSIKYLLHNDTADVLLKTIKGHGPRASIYLLEQVANLIANMSSTLEARTSLTKAGAPTALMCFLQSHSLDDEVLKRLQQKSIIGLSRLCGEKDAAKQIVEMGGVRRLVNLCRDKKERFDSDAILVAALATLRKITDACGVSVVNEEDAQELIQPKLLDSFMAYSAQNESLV
ncbi:PREDICTED: protein inscuteable homolog [Nicrophorus vespilloides]|uniref:Protein inscuteable homolog n=1 Tax=Nicrophorus vespilloides TaxID=110193 RepID=A0ABM1N9X9_NICVS|nr:PREDICTED: protein inscuteable homolog [Nicrophorus vespilloides]